MESIIASFDIMSKGMLGSFAVAGIMALLTFAMVKFFEKNSAGKKQ